MSYIAFDELRWAVLVNTLESDETPEHNNHDPEEDYHSSHNASPPSPQSQSSPSSPPRHSSTFSNFYHPFHSLGILPTNVLKKVKTVYRTLAGFLHSDAWNISRPHSKEEGSDMFQLISNDYTSLICSNYCI